MPLTAAPPRVYYEQRGAGPPLLAITGFGFSSAVLEPLVAVGAKRLRWITYDHPASGRSSKRAFPCTTGKLAAGAVRVLDELGIESAHVAGMSLGGAVALELALRSPERVRSLILIGTTAAGPLSRKTDLRRLAGLTARILAGSLQRRRLSIGSAVFSARFLEREPDRAETLTALLSAHPPAPWGVLGQCCAAGLHNRARDLERIRVPTLVLHGDRDRLVPLANAEQLARGIAGAEFHVYRNAGHAFAVEQPEATAALICDWIARRTGDCAVPPP